MFVDVCDSVCVCVSSGCTFVWRLGHNSVVIPTYFILRQKMRALPGLGLSKQLDQLTKQPQGCTCLHFPSTRVPSARQHTRPFYMFPGVELRSSPSKHFVV